MMVRDTFEKEGPLLVIASGRDTISVVSSIKWLATDNVFVVQVKLCFTPLFSFFFWNVIFLWSFHYVAFFSYWRSLVLIQRFTFGMVKVPIHTWNIWHEPMLLLSQLTR